MNRYFTAGYCRQSRACSLQLRFASRGRRIVKIKPQGHPTDRSSRRFAKVQCICRATHKLV